MDMTPAVVAVFSSLQQRNLFLKHVDLCTHAVIAFCQLFFSFNAAILYLSDAKKRETDRQQKKGIFSQIIWAYILFHENVGTHIIHNSFKFILNNYASMNVFIFYFLMKISRQEKTSWQQFLFCKSPLLHLQFLRSLCNF